MAAGGGSAEAGDLNGGKRDEFTVTFAHVFRNIDHAKYFYVTVETNKEVKRS